jgi:hypothetical protein
MLKLNNNRLSSLVGVDIIFPRLLLEPLGLTMLDISFNQIEKVEKVSVIGREQYEGERVGEPLNLSAHAFAANDRDCADSVPFQWSHSCGHS